MDKEMLAQLDAALNAGASRVPDLAGLLMDTTIIFGEEAGVELFKRYLKAYVMAHLADGRRGEADGPLLDQMAWKCQREAEAYGKELVDNKPAGIL